MWEAHMHGGDKPGQVKILRLILIMMDFLKIGNSSSYFLSIEHTILKFQYLKNIFKFQYFIFKKFTHFTPNFSGIKHSTF